jgi:hypothetical protein
MRSARTRGACLAASVLLGLAGCDRNAEAPAPTRPPQPPPASADGPAAFDPVGTWVIVGHHMPGISAVDADEAGSRNGETLLLTVSRAIASNDACDAATYSTRSVPADDYLASEYKLEPGRLKPVAGRGRLRLVEIACDGTPWIGFGALLIEVDANRVLTPWDGVFYELERTAGPKPAA